jgi:hypothetical protein
MVKRFQFGPVCFFQCPAFVSPEPFIDNNRLIEPPMDMIGICLLLSSCFFMEYLLCR